MTSNKFLSVLVFLLFFSVFQTSVNATWNIFVGGQVYYYNSAASAGSDPWTLWNPTTMGQLNISASANSVYSTGTGGYLNSTSLSTSGGFHLNASPTVTCCAASLGSFFNDTGAVTGGKTDLNITITFPGKNFTANQNVSIVIRNVSSQVNFSATDFVNLTIRIAMDNNLGIIENIHGTFPSSNSTMASVMMVIGNQSTTSTYRWNFTDIDFSLPTKIPYKPTGVGVCSQFNNSLTSGGLASGMGNPATNSCKYFASTNTYLNWNVLAGPANSYTNSTYSFSLTNTTLGGLQQFTDATGARANETAIVAAFWPEIVNPKPAIKAGPGASVRILTGADLIPIRHNRSLSNGTYSAVLPLVKPNITKNSSGGVIFGGMKLGKDDYAQMIFNDKAFFQFPTRMEFLAYNLSFNVTFTTNSSVLVNITPPVPRVTAAGQDPFTLNPLYKNQTLLPANFQTFSFFDVNGTRSMTVMIKNPSNFSLDYVNCNGISSTITGGFTLGAAPSAQFSQGDVILNLTGNSTCPGEVKMQLGLQDQSCFGSFGDISACFADGSAPRFEASPVYITNQSVIGFNPFASNPNDAKDLGFEGTTTFVVNMTNPLLNYTAANISVDFMFPLNVTIWTGALGGTAQQTTNITTAHSVGWLNQSTGTWVGLNVTCGDTCSGTPYLNITDELINITDAIPGSPFSNKNMTMYFRKFRFFLNQTVHGISNADGSIGCPAGICWTYGDNLTLNASAQVGFRLLNETKATTGGEFGAKGSTNTYNVSLAGQGTIVRINSTLLKNIDDATLSSIKVRLNGQLLDPANWTRGSIIVSLGDNSVGGNSVVSVEYTVPAAAAAATSAANGGSTTGAAAAAGKETSTTFQKLTPGVASIFHVDDDSLGLKQIEIFVNNEATNVKLTVTKLDGQPASITQELSGTVFKYMEIRADDLPESNINQVKIQFPVSNAWIAENNIDRNTVRLNRFANGRWVPLTTKSKGALGDNIIFEGVSPGLSTFAVTGEPLAPGEEAPTEEVPPYETTTTTIPYGGTGDYTLIGIVLVALLVGGWYMMQRGKKAKHGKHSE